MEAGFPLAMAIVGCRFDGLEESLWVPKTQSAL
jgi:hypothetical protein